METSIFIGKIMGIYLFVIGLAALFNQEYFRKILQEGAQKTFTIFFTGIVCFVLGLILVVSHNVWEENWQVAITIISWLTLLKGGLHLFFPAAIQDLWKKVLLKHSFTWASWISLIIGIYLMYMSFYKVVL